MPRGLHGTESQDPLLGDLELVCSNEAVLSRGTGPGIHTNMNRKLASDIVRSSKVDPSP